MTGSRYPLLYQINTRVWLTALSATLGRRATLDDVPDAELDRLARMGFDWVWLLSVWQTGPEARRVSRDNAEWRREFEQTLPDLAADDIGGSGFAITGYSVHTDLGGDAALARLRERLRGRGLRLMLDFVPNHVGLGHPWIGDHPDYFIRGTELDLALAPHDYTWVKRRDGDVLLAHGRDPYFPGWPDTLQLDYANPATQEAMIGELLGIAARCDGVRCDMAMLVLPEVFERTWVRRAAPFWPAATRRVRERVPGFLFMAEVYWDLEWTLQQQGFDYAYDKRLYDRLREGHARPVREHLHAGLDYQDKLARFLENHDEPRGGGDVPDAGARGRGGHLVPRPRPAFLPPGPVRGPQETHPAPPRARPGRTRRRALEGLLRTPARRAAPAGGARRPMATPPLHARVGGQLDGRLLRGVRVAGPGRGRAGRRRELRRQPEPVPRAPALRGPRRKKMATAGPAEFGRLRVERRRPCGTRALPGHGALAVRRVRG